MVVITRAYEGNRISNWLEMSVDSLKGFDPTGVHSIAFVYQAKLNFVGFFNLLDLQAETYFFFNTTNRYSIFGWFFEPGKLYDLDYTGSESGPAQHSNKVSQNGDSSEPRAPRPAASRKSHKARPTKSSGFIVEEME